ncbi:MAG: glycosyltransferase [Oscillospiraceae bacterium]|nr:glycosyltransferase [Oscillospiraceae bacterium]
MKYLFIVTESASANGICTKAIMDVLAKNNEVFCITNREWGSETSYVKDGIAYYTVKPRLVYRISSMIAKRNMPQLLKKALQLIKRVMDRAKLLVSLPTWPLISPAYSKRIEKEARRLCGEFGIACIVPVYTQIDTLIAADRIKKDHDEIMYIPYFLDSLSGGYGLRVFSEMQTRVRALRWERRLLQSADWIIAMESSRKHHEKYSFSESYYGKMKFLDLPLLRTELPDAAEPLFDEKCCNLVYVGTLPHGIRSPKYILNVFKMLEGQQYQLWFIGTNDNVTLNEAVSEDTRIHIVGRCSHEIAMQYELQADVLINIGNTNPNMTPSKIFEYMSFAKPIVSTKASDEEPSVRYLGKYPQTLILDEERTDFASAAEELKSFIERSSTQGIDCGRIHEVFFRNTPQAFADFLEEQTGAEKNEGSADQFI